MARVTEDIKEEEAVHHWNVRWIVLKKQEKQVGLCLEEWGPCHETHTLMRLQNLHPNRSKRLYVTPVPEVDEEMAFTQLSYTLHRQDDIACMELLLLDEGGPSFEAVVSPPVDLGRKPAGPSCSRTEWLLFFCGLMAPEPATRKGKRELFLLAGRKGSSGRQFQAT
ncbi:hypothetical protein CDL15_Pgr027644 [Punica granatum]|uniref:Uncharacterized protein n=1 Tax=Punica granatum TaxID=22663 RepID=A0A218XIU1_PUNGR|nr:hypothetical protein CDL15_Pgr027644 [Punica granatum]